MSDGPIICRAVGEGRIIMETSLKAMRKLTRESDHIVLISGLGVARAAGLNGVRAEHIAYDIEQKYGYSNDPCFCQKG